MGRILCWPAVCNVLGWWGEGGVNKMLKGLLIYCLSCPYEKEVMSNNMKVQHVVQFHISHVHLAGIGSGIRTCCMLITCKMHSVAP